MGKKPGKKLDTDGMSRFMQEVLMLRGKIAVYEKRSEEARQTGAMFEAGYHQGQADECRRLVEQLERWRNDQAAHDPGYATVLGFDPSS